MTLRCPYCLAAVPARVKRNAAARGKTPRFCGARNHGKLYDGRRRRLIDRGFAGEALEAELARLAQAKRKGVRSRGASIAKPVAPRSARPPKTPPQRPQSPPTVAVPRGFTRAGILEELERGLP
jgi:hypothetical protein